MTPPRRKIIFVASTGGHVRGLVELAKRLQRSGAAEPAILNFPSDLGIGLNMGKELSGIQEFVWAGDRVALREEIESEKRRINKPTRFGKISDATLRWGILVLGTRISLLLFCAVLTWQALACSIAWLFASGAHPKPSLHGEFLRKLFIETFAAISSLWRLMSSPQSSSVGRRILFAAQHGIFFGLWKSCLELDCITRFFEEYKPDLIVLPEQNCGYGHAILFAWARRTGTPILVLPYTTAGRQEWATNFKEWPECHVKGILRRLVAQAFPDWVYGYKGDQLILPLPWLISSEHLRCTPSIPWVTNSGPDGVFAVDNLFTKEFYEREGVDTSGWRIVGSLVEDRLFFARQQRDVIQAETARCLGLNPELPIILIALPPNQFDMCVKKDVEFDDFNALVRFIVGATVEAAVGRFNVVVNLHPRTRKKDVAFIEDGLARIADCPIEELLPAAHLYISVASATIRWAIACEVPVINYDAYRYNYCDYHGLGGVVDVKSCEQFKQQLALIVNDDAYRDRLVQAQAADAARLFRVDGKAEDRIIGLMTALCDTPRSVEVRSSVE